MFVHSTELPLPRLLLQDPVIYSDLLWSGCISISSLRWTETDAQCLRTFVAFTTNQRCKTEEWCLFNSLKKEETAREKEKL